MRVKVVVRLRFEGIHCWPDCPEDGPTPFLRHPHRHEFHVEAKKPVSHDDRDIEFIELKRQIEQHCKLFAGPHTRSCESMARELVERFGLSSCSVFEDGENGAEVVA